LNLIWQANRRILEPELTLVSTTDELCYQWANFVLSFELSQHDAEDNEDVGQSEDPFRMTVIPAGSVRATSKADRETLVRYWQLGELWEIGLRQAAQVQVSLCLGKVGYTDSPDGECSISSTIWIDSGALGKQIPHPAWPILLEPSSCSESETFHRMSMLIG
jgi:hypothetical protein